MSARGRRRPGDNAEQTKQDREERGTGAPSPDSGIRRAIMSANQDVMIERAGVAGCGHPAIMPTDGPAVTGEVGPKVPRRPRQSTSSPELIAIA